MKTKRKCENSTNIPVACGKLGQVLTIIFNKLLHFFHIYLYKYTITVTDHSHDLNINIFELKYTRGFSCFNTYL